MILIMPKLKSVFLFFPLIEKPLTNPFQLVSLVMKTPNYPQLKSSFPWQLFAIVFFMFPSTGKSQCDSIIALTCETAVEMPLLNFCGRTAYLPYNCCNGWCGSNTAIHNPTYFKFTATDTIISIDIEVLPCYSGVGLQAAIIPVCPWANDDILDCDPGTPPGGTMELDATNVIPGQDYWLVIDGSSGAVCSYLISGVSGLFKPYEHHVFLQQSGDTIHAVHEGQFEYAWFKCEDNITLGTDPYFIPQTSGCYCVEVYDGPNSSVFCTTAQATSTEDVVKDERVSFYPNPSIDGVEINIKDFLNAEATLKIFDNQGRLVDQVLLNSDTYRYSWKSHELKGMYLFMIESNGKILAYQKVIYSR